MANDFYTPSNAPATSSNLSSATMRAEFQAIAQGLDKLPALTGNALKKVRVNASGTGLEAVTDTTASEIQSGAYVALSSVAGTNTITATANPTLTSYAANQTFRFIAAASNTGAVTINIDGLGPKAITKSGATPLTSGDINVGAVIQVTYDGTQFQLISGAGSQAASAVTQTFSGNGSTTVFTLAQAPATQNSCEVFISGVAQVPGVDYTVSGTTLTFIAGAPPAGTGNILARYFYAILVGVPSDGSVTQAKMDSTYEATLVKLAGAQTLTGAKRGTQTVDNDLSFDLNAGNNFVCTTAGTGTLTFTNIASAAGQSGFIELINSSNHTISKAATTKTSSTFLTTVSATGTYVISYFCDGTNVFCTTTGALS